MISCTCDGHSHICDECIGKIKTIWYEPLVEALRHHIEAKHMMEEDALSELKFTEEYLDYASHCDGDLVTIGCPWQQHHNCNWKVEGNVFIELKINKSL